MPRSIHLPCMAARLPQPIDRPEAPGVDVAYLRVSLSAPVGRTGNTPRPMLAFCRIHAGRFPGDPLLAEYHTTDDFKGLWFRPSNESAWYRCDVSHSGYVNGGTWGVREDGTDVRTPYFTTLESFQHTMERHVMAHGPNPLWMESEPDPNAHYAVTNHKIKVERAERIRKRQQEMVVDAKVRAYRNFKAALKAPAGWDRMSLSVVKPGREYLPFAPALPDAPPYYNLLVTLAKRGERRLRAAFRAVIGVRGLEVYDLETHMWYTEPTTGGVTMRDSNMVRNLVRDHMRREFGRA